MGSELERTGGFSREEREAGKQRRLARIEVRNTAHKIEGAKLLAQHAMNEIIDLDEHRRRLANGDQTHNLLLAELEETCLQQVKQLQRQLFSEWGL